MVNADNGMQLSNETNYTGTCYNMDESQNNYAKRKKPDKKGVHTLWFHLLYTILENSN